MRQEERPGGGDYRGYGVCPDCGANMGRLRDDPITTDRCPKCGAEWELVDGRHRWLRVS